MVYVFVNRNISMPQLDADQYGGRHGGAAAITVEESGAWKRRMKEALSAVPAGSTLATSSLVNFGRGTAAMLDVLTGLWGRGVRVVAEAEGFDSAECDFGAYMDVLRLLRLYNGAAAGLDREARREGIRRAVAEGKYRGREAIRTEDIPGFGEDVGMYMSREIRTKVELARRLGVSRPTLDRLLKEAGEARTPWQGRKEKEEGKAGIG